MDRARGTRWARGGAMALLAAIAAPWAIVPSPAGKSAVRSVKPPPIELSSVSVRPDSSSVDFFAAIDRGELAARLLPEEGQHARLEVENRTNRPLSVALPPALGGRASVLQHAWERRRLNPSEAAWAADSCAFRRNGSAISDPGTACLDDSKPEPTPGMVYDVCRIDELARPGVAKLCGDARRRKDRPPRPCRRPCGILNCDRSWGRGFRPGCKVAAARMARRNSLAGRKSGRRSGWRRWRCDEPTARAISSTKARRRAARSRKRRQSQLSYAGHVSCRETARDSERPSPRLGRQSCWLPPPKPAEKRAPVLVSV